MKLSNNTGKKRRHSNDSEMNTKMYHKEMFLTYIIRPFKEAFDGTFDYLITKLFFLIAGFPALFALDLFQTPELWWKGLGYLVALDWVGGVVVATKSGEFSWNECTRKWYQVTGYIMVCSAVAIVSNGFPKVFYYFQYAVYATFFLKEFVSILQTWNVLTIFTIAWEALRKGKLTSKTFRQFRDELEQRVKEEDV